MRPLGLVEPKPTRERVQHRLRDALEVPALQGGVVVDADASEHRHLLTAQPEDAAGAAEDRQACLLRRDPGPPRGQELTDLAPVVHDHDGTAPEWSLRGSVRPCFNRDSHPCGDPRFGVPMTEKHGATLVKHISLGGLDVSRIGLGTMGMSAYYTGAGSDDAESIRAIHRALDLGVTHIDTAEIYGALHQRRARRPNHQGPP